MVIEKMGSAAYGHQQTDALNSVPICHNLSTPSLQLAMSDLSNNREDKLCFHAYHAYLDKFRLEVVNSDGGG